MKYVSVNEIRIAHDEIKESLEGRPINGLLQQASNHREILLGHLNRIGALQDKIRYAADERIQEGYVQELLDYFDAGSGDPK